MVLLLWKFSLFIFVWLEQDRPFRLLPGGSGPSDHPPPPPPPPAQTSRRQPPVRCVPASAAAQYGHTGAFRLSRPNSGHKAEHGDPSRGQPLWRHVREEVLDTSGWTERLPGNDGDVADLPDLDKLSSIQLMYLSSRSNTYLAGDWTNHLSITGELQSVRRRTDTSNKISSAGLTDASSVCADLFVFDCASSYDTVRQRLARSLTRRILA
ncbi:hypothetical protein GBF38_021376 [Nibea albiflora]|uniref:Uncharacterized protein n=1 Tax=Nibea albiflora TaxID=240163 RepID=A0ACB7FJ83_NIBAL|nr:hypothetical protein GBF38_021376 [Nibea albiflora]